MNLKSEIEQIFVFNNDLLVIIQENMLYLNENGKENSKAQFNLIDYSKISDIVQLVILVKENFNKINSIFSIFLKKLFEDSESKLEVTLVDELNNSGQITWSLKINNLHILSQLIKHLKEHWEAIYSIELPISF